MPERGAKHRALQKVTGSDSDSFIKGARAEADFAPFKFKKLKLVPCQISCCILGCMFVDLPSLKGFFVSRSCCYLSMRSMPGVVLSVLSVLAGVVDPVS